jgi:hypothetical protein
MYALAERYHGDLKKILLRRGDKARPLSSLPLRDFYNFVRSIPFKRDRRPVEVVGRPARILKLSGGLDCKKKGVLIGAYFRDHGLVPGRDWRYVATSRRSDGQIHHVFPQLLVGSTVDCCWRNVDATYPDDELFAEKKVTAMEVLNP